MQYTFNLSIYPSYLSKGLIIRTTTRPSRKCELMKLSLPLVSSMYRCCFHGKYWNSLPDEYAPCHHL